MTGAIWLVQVLVYPNFQRVGSREFEMFHQFHLSRITWVVAPIMAIELTTAAWLYFNLETTINLINLISILPLWVLTALVNVPSHHSLGFENLASKNSLVLKNWPRTVIWTARAVFLSWVLLNPETVVN